MSHNTLALIAGVIGVLSSVPYIVSVAKGHTHPNIVTWLTWTLLNVINVASTWAAGQTQTAIIGGFSAAATTAIVIMGFRHGVKRYTAFDIACQAIALLGLLAWQLSHEPAVALTIALAVDVVAAAPTWRHAWLAPFAENWQSFAIAAVSGIPTFLAISSYNYMSLAFPVLITANSLLMVTIILLRRRRLAPPAPPPSAPAQPA